MENKNGWIRTEYSDGTVYEGDSVDGKAHGTGTTKYANGDVYEGEWKDGQRHGTGTTKYANGDVYEGEWMDGQRHGTGTMKVARGNLYKRVYSNGDLMSNTLINGPPSRRPHTNEATNMVLLNDEHIICDICNYEFSFDRDTDNENIKMHLPVLSKTCGHWYCHGCILHDEAVEAESNNGIAPEWIPCLGLCTATKDAFCPRKPNYHIFLIDLLDRSIPVIEETSK